MSAPTRSEPPMGVMLHSYVREFLRGRYSLADCLARVAELGNHRRFELIGAQSLRGYPRLLPELERGFRRAVERYDLEPLCYDAFVERGRRPGAVATLTEAAELIAAEVDIASRLGFAMFRLNSATPELFDLVVPMTERAGLTLLVELHGETINSPSTQRLVEWIDRSGSETVGFLQDFGAFVTSLPDAWIERGLWSGVDAPIVDVVVDAWLNGAPATEARDAAINLGGTPVMIDWVNQTFAMFIRNEPAVLTQTVPYLRYVHAKFYGLDRRGEEPCIPYEALLGILRAADYGGVITSEYLSWAPFGNLDSAEQVQAHHQMVARVWVSAEQAG